MCLTASALAVAHATVRVSPVLIPLADRLLSHSFANTGVNGTGCGDDVWMDSALGISTAFIDSAQLVPFCSSLLGLGLSSGPPPFYSCSQTDIMNMCTPGSQRDFTKPPTQCFPSSDPINFHTPNGNVALFTMCTNAYPIPGLSTNFATTPRSLFG